MYIVIELQKNADGKVANIVTSYETRLEAESKYHQILANAATSSVPVHSAVVLLDDGNPLLNQSYRHVVE